MKNAVPVLVVAALVVLWYVGAVALNWNGVVDTYKLKGIENNGTSDIFIGTMTAEKPLLPAPHQVVAELWNTTVTQALTSKRSLLYHAWITLSATLLGFAFGSILGIGLAVLIVHNGATDRSLMP